MTGRGGMAESRMEIITGEMEMAAGWLEIIMRRPETITGKLETIKEIVPNSHGGIWGNGNRIQGRDSCSQRHQQYGAGRHLIQKSWLLCVRAATKNSCRWRTDYLNASGVFQRVYIMPSLSNLAYQASPILSEMITRTAANDPKPFLGRQYNFTKYCNFPMS